MAEQQALFDGNRAAAAAGVAAARDLVTEWQALRIVIAEMEAAEHPPITDALGRMWTWMPSGARDRDGNDSSDLYAHDGMAWPREHVESPDIGLPMPGVLDNPNYQWCDLCRQPSFRLESGRRVPVVTVKLPEVVGAGG